LNETERGGKRKNKGRRICPKKSGEAITERTGKGVHKSPTSKEEAGGSGFLSIGEQGEGLPKKEGAAAGHPGEKERSSV